MRKTNLLRRVDQFQQWAQQGIPVVFRFLGELFEARWNGTDFFLEVLRLIVHLPIASFDGKIKMS